MALRIIQGGGGIGDTYNDNDMVMGYGTEDNSGGGYEGYSFWPRHGGKYPFEYEQLDMTSP